MSRRKPMAIRNPCGRISRSDHQELLAPTQVRRLLDAAAAGLRDALWSTMLGRIHLAGKITAAQFAAGKRWAELVSDYSTACQSPRAPQTVLFDAKGGTPADPDSEKGAREAPRHERAVARYLEGRHALRLAGPHAECVVTSVCISDHAPAVFDELNALRAGLQSLSAQWSARRKAGPR